MKLLFAIYFVTTILLMNKYDIKLKKNDFRLERQAFWDPLRIRYNTLWIVYQQHLFEETRLICNTFYSVRKEDY